MIWPQNCGLFKKRETTAVKVHIWCTRSFPCSIKKLQSPSWDPGGSRHKQQSPAGACTEQVLRLFEEHVEREQAGLCSPSEAGMYLGAVLPSPHGWDRVLAHAVLAHTWTPGGLFPEQTQPLGVRHTTQNIILNQRYASQIETHGFKCCSAGDWTE